MGYQFLRIPLMAVQFIVRRWGWKALLAGWAASLALIPVLIHYGF